jgi:hypothetical protein
MVGGTPMTRKFCLQILLSPIFSILAETLSFHVRFDIILSNMTVARMTGQGHIHLPASYIY